MLNLAEHGILVSVNVSLAGLLGERKDTTATEYVESTYGMAHKRAKATKYLIDRTHPKVRAVIAAAQQVRNVGYRFGFSWSGEMRFVPHKAREAFEAAMVSAIASFEGACDEYALYYPSLVTDSKRDLGGLFDSSQYPGRETVRKLLRASYTPWPMPDSGMFHNLTQEVVEKYQAKMKAETVQLTNSAVNQLIARVEKTVSAFVSKLAAYSDAGDKVTGIFRDSLVSNVADIGSLVKQLNFTNDPGIDAMALQIERLARYSAETLRQAPGTRQSMVAEGEALLNRLATFKKTESDVGDLLSQVADYQ